jgi:hypothetical protein
MLIIQILEKVMKEVIVDTSFGGASVYPATLKNAKALLEVALENISPEVVDIYEKNKKVINKSNIVRIINKILSGKDGEMASKTIEINKESREEIIFYCFSNNIGIKNNKVEEYEFLKNFNLADLSFFANNENYPKEAVLVDEYILDQLSKYRTVKENRWKEGASIIGKVRYILEFAMELSHRDVKYDVVKVSPSV